MTSFDFKSCFTSILLMMCLSVTTCQETSSAVSTTPVIPDTAATSEVANVTELSTNPSSETAAAPALSETPFPGSTQANSSTSETMTTLPEETNATNSGEKGEREDITTFGPVTVEVYYTSYCRRSAYFIREQLEPTYRRLPEVIDLRLVPFGRANETQLENGTWEFQCCPMSPLNCFPDMLQTCAINLINSTEMSLTFISCLLRFPPNPQRGLLCARPLGLDYAQLEQCTKSEQGKQWFHEMGVLTSDLKEPLTRMPRIVVNGMSNFTIEKKAFINLTRLVCEMLQEPKPPQCNMMVEVINIIPLERMTRSSTRLRLF